MGAEGSETHESLSAEDAASAFGAILEALSGAVSPVLIDAAGWSRLRDTVGGLPVDPGIGFGFEFRLGDVAPGTDFYIPLPRDTLLARHYIRCSQRQAPGSAAAAVGTALSAIDVGAPWSEILGVEYDIRSGSPGAPPGLFVRIRSDLAEASTKEFPTAEEVAAWLAGAVGWRVAEAERQALGRTFDAIAAAGGTVADLGIMPGRADRAFKVISRALHPADAVPLLMQLQWPGPVNEVAAFLSRFDGLFRVLRLAVSVTGGGALPRVGLELFQGDPGLLCQPGVGDWAPFLARLCEQRLCLPEKRDGLLAWPGQDLVFCGRKTLGLSTGLAHVKVSFEERHEGAAVEAKAYPAAGYLPFEAIPSRFASR